MNLWFTEDLAITPGLRLQVQVNETLHTEQTPFQALSIVSTQRCGRMLLLDDVIQTTEMDEFAYHEMISHVPLFAHPNPERVLIIGGGDCGTAREVLRHSSVKEVDMCEIDRRVVELSKEYLPQHTSSLGDPRLKLHYDDGAKWAREHPDYYDVIIVDSSDPIGPAAVLFQRPFFESCREALRGNGILVSQAENFFFNADIISEVMRHGEELFAVHRYYYTIVPTYPGGMIGFTFFSKKFQPSDNLRERIQVAESEGWLDSLNYWSEELQSAAFILPRKAARDILPQR